MALAYDVHGNVVQAVIIGSHKLSEVRALLDAALSSPRVALPLRIVIDAGEASFSDTLEDVCLSTDELASRHSVIDSRCALVVAEPLRRLLSWTLVFYARRHGIDLRTFADAQQARSWLTNPAAFPHRSAGAAWTAAAGASQPRPTTSAKGT